MISSISQTRAGHTAKNELDDPYAAFGSEIEALRREVELQLGADDAAHIRAIGKLSQRLEITGRSLLHFSFEPLAFSAGTLALWAHKSLELMEIGHMALHGA